MPEEDLFGIQMNKSLLNQKQISIFQGAQSTIYSKRYYLGIAGHHLTQPDEGLQGSSKLPLKITAHAGAIVFLKKVTNRLFLQIFYFSNNKILPN